MSIIERKVTTYRAECDDCGWTGYRAFRKSMAEGDLAHHVCGLHREAHGSRSHRGILGGYWYSCVCGAGWTEHELVPWKCPRSDA